MTFWKRLKHHQNLPPRLLLLAPVIQSQSLLHPQHYTYTFPECDSEQSMVQPAQDCLILAKRSTPFATNSLAMLSFLAKLREAFVEELLAYLFAYNLSSLDGKIFTKDVWQNRIGYFLLFLKYLLYSKQPLTVHFSLATLWFPECTHPFIPAVALALWPVFTLGGRLQFPAAHPTTHVLIPELLSKEFLQSNHEIYCQCKRCLLNRKITSSCYSCQRRERDNTW